jgi:hypothetical protein
LGKFGVFAALPNGIAKAGQATNKFGVGRIKPIKQASDPEFIGGLTQNFLPSRSRWAKPIFAVGAVYDRISLIRGKTGAHRAPLQLPPKKTIKYPDPNYR